MRGRADLAKVESALLAGALDNGQLHADTDRVKHVVAHHVAGLTRADLVRLVAMQAWTGAALVRRFGTDPQTLITELAEHPADAIARQVASINPSPTST